MTYFDYTKIKDIKFKFPEIMGENSKSEILMLFERIANLKNTISDLRMEATEREKTLKELEKEWNTILPLLDIEFETKEKEEVHGEINIGFNFGTEVNKYIH